MIEMSEKTSSFLLILVLLLSSSGLHAANRFSLLHSRPAPGSGEFFTLLESKTLSQWDWAAGTAFTYGHLPLKATNINIVRDHINQHVYGAIGLTDWLDFSIDLPVTWFSRLTNPDTGAGPINKVGLGDIQLTARVELLDRDRFAFGIGIAPFITVPTGDASSFMGDEGVTGGGKLIFDGTLGKRVTWALNVGSLIRE